MKSFLMKNNKILQTDKLVFKSSFEKSLPIFILRNKN
jgi:hypothetical protein